TWKWPKLLNSTVRNSSTCSTLTTLKQATTRLRNVHRQASNFGARLHSQNEPRHRAVGCGGVQHQPVGRSRNNREKSTSGAANQACTSERLVQCNGLRAHREDATDLLDMNARTHTRQTGRESQ